MSSANKDNFTPFFPIWMVIISYVIPVVSTSSTVLNKSSESEHSVFCVVPDLKGNTFTFSL